MIVADTELYEERQYSITLKNREFAMRGINDSLFGANSLFSRIFEELAH
jgi:hypothetical protein